MADNESTFLEVEGQRIAVEQERNVVLGALSAALSRLAEVWNITVENAYGGRQMFEAVTKSCLVIKCVRRLK